MVLFLLRLFSRFEPQTTADSPPSISAPNAPRRHDFFVCFEPNPTKTGSFYGRAPCVRAPVTAPSLPEHTPSVAPRPPELHFYSGRHVRARVRLHLRRVTENNNARRLEKDGRADGGNGRKRTKLGRRSTEFSDSYRTTTMKDAYWGIF